VLVSTEYASASLLFVRVRGRKRKIGFQSALLGTD